MGLSHPYVQYCPESAGHVVAPVYAPENGAGVKELSRPISRLRHREFGIIVTTPFLGHQAYQELHSGRHPLLRPRLCIGLAAEHQALPAVALAKSGDANRIREIRGPLHEMPDPPETAH